MGLVRYYDIAIGYVIVPIFRYSTIAVVVSTVQFEPHTKSRKLGLYIP